MVARSPEPKTHVSNVRAFRIELEFRSVGFYEKGKPECPEKNVWDQRREPTTNSTHMIKPSPGIKHRVTLVVSALTTAQSLLPGNIKSSLTYIVCEEYTISASRAWSSSVWLTSLWRQSVIGHCLLSLTVFAQWLILKEGQFSASAETLVLQMELIKKKNKVTAISTSLLASYMKQYRNVIYLFSQSYRKYKVHISVYYGRFLCFSTWWKRKLFASHTEWNTTEWLSH